MSELQPVEEIWVTAAEGAEKTGFHLDHVRRLARENWRLPEDKRLIRVRKESKEYAIWLPDLMNHAVRNTPFVNNPDQLPTDEIWVNTGEAADITGYNQRYLTRIATKYSNMPEAQREIKVINRAGRYELWLPDLIKYIKNIGHGPHLKPASNEDSPN